MRLWHESLLPHLPRQQLLGQHRECCALRGNGWGKPHSIINYIFNYSLDRLYTYHVKVMDEMQRRGYKPGECWLNPSYRGKVADPHNSTPESIEGIVYPEHNTEYLRECLDNLKGKGIVIEM